MSNDNKINNQLICLKTGSKAKIIDFFDKDKVRHIYFIAETKGSDSDMDLREIEKLKIHCATEHFKEVSGAQVNFKKVASFNTLVEMLELK